MAYVSMAKKEMVRQALREDKGKVARAIRICREQNIPPSVFGALLKEGYAVVKIGDKYVDTIYGYRCDGIKLAGKYESIDDQLRYVAERRSRWIKEALEEEERKKEKEAKKRAEAEAKGENYEEEPKKKYRTR